MENKQKLKFGDIIEKLKTLLENKTCSLDNYKEIEKQFKINDIDSKYYTNFRWPHGESILHWAASNGNVDIIDYIYNQGSYINAENMYGANPLFYASLKENFYAVKYLISKGANIESYSVFSGANVLEPVPDYGLGFCSNRKKSDLRIQITKYIEKFIKLKDTCSSKSPIFKNTYMKNKKNRDAFELEWRSVETTEGGYNKIGYWGIPNSIVYDKYKTLQKNDQELFDIMNKKKWCLNCLNINNISKCMGCKKAYYCNKTCQINHWKFHKKFCKK